ncbi:MAG: hypothetical protein JXR96_00300 [Deltaproteobacteria bacterium]|nr:hypothetical protein [Deltaproteobacteria bacterium]
MRMLSYPVLFALAVALLGAGLPACSDSKYESAPKASDKETQLMKERFQALVSEAKTLEPGGEYNLLHHFGDAALTCVKPADFKAKAAAFAKDAAAGKYDQVEYRGGRDPGKVRLLLITAGQSKGALPFVKSADGWMLDDVDIGLGDYQKEPNTKGSTPAKPPSPLAAIAVLIDDQASAMERTAAAIELATAKDKETADKYAAKEKDPWPKAALLYAAWQAGGACEPFAKAFPIDGEQQKEIYENDTPSYRTLIQALSKCAAESKGIAPALQLYRACHKAEGGPRSEYVDPVVAMADAQPMHVLKASLKAGIKYEEDPVANILVGALHGEQRSPFYQFVTKHAGERGPTAKLAKEWVDKMAERDKLEPPGTHPAVEGGQEGGG